MSIDIETFEKYGEGDTFLVTDLLPQGAADEAFEKLRDEVRWDQMFHRGGEVPRLVAVEGQVAEDGSFPIYRHPADSSPPLFPFSTTVELIRNRVSEILQQPLNHVLIQWYRHGGDYISEHSDKTVDVVKGSKIVNVSLGAQRTMTLRTKKDDGQERNTQRIPLPHNSVFVMGLETNEKWLHSIRKDGRIPTIKSPPEVAFNQQRISLTFRHIGTFLTADQKRIWGQGAKSKEKVTAGVVTNEVTEAEELIWAFGEENHISHFDWDAVYGKGFDVVHFASINPSQENA